MYKLKRYVLCALMIFCFGIGLSITVKAGVGLGPWDALSQSIAYITAAKVGTIGMILNLSCVAVEWMILKKDFRLKHALQIGSSILLGFIMNFFIYRVFAGWNPSSYFLRLTMLVLGVITAALCNAVILLLDVLTFSLEGAVSVVAKRFRLPFAPSRQFVDLFSIVLALTISFLSRNPWTVREGTIISMLLYSPILGQAMKFFKPVMERRFPEQKTDSDTI